MLEVKNKFRIQFFFSRLSLSDIQKENSEKTKLSDSIKCYFIKLTAAIGKQSE